MKSKALGRLGAGAAARGRLLGVLFFGPPPPTGQDHGADGLQKRLRRLCDLSLMAKAGFLFAHGADLEDLTQRAAAQIDKIVNGFPAGELPIERPTKFLLTVNLKATRALGIAMPPSLLARADEVIQ